MSNSLVAGAAAGTALILPLLAQAPTQLFQIEMPVWAQGSIYVVVVVLLIWLIVQSQSRYDGLLKRIDEHDKARLGLEKERIDLEKQRIVADVQQTGQITSLAATIERLDSSIRSNTDAVRRCPAVDRVSHSQ